MEYFVGLERALDLARRVSLEEKVEMVSLDRAHGRFLATDLSSLVDDPPFDNSSMDGFAVREEDVKDIPCNLEIVGVSQAMATEEQIMVGVGQAARVMTGAIIPKGADAIIMVEKTKTSEDESIVELHELAKKGWIRKKGENLREGQVALTGGTRLSPHHLGLAATMGHPLLPLHRRLIISIIPTGDELKQPGEELVQGEIYESNSFGLAGLVKQLDCLPLRRETCADSLDALRKALDTAADESDVILTSGGVSMGEWDLVRRLMEEEGDIHFWRVKIRPGSPPLFGTWKGTPLFGLPGNPVSSHVVFRMLVKPWLLAQMGVEPPYENLIPVVLLEDIKAAEKCHTLRRINVEKSDEGLVASLKTHQGSGNLHSMVAANALTFLPPGSTAKAGEVIDVIML